MATFLMIGKYSPESIKDASADRTVKAAGLISELGGEVKAMYALLGGFDLVLVVDLPSADVAMKASLGLNVLTGISFNTYPAVSVDDFDRMLGEVT